MKDEEVKYGQFCPVAKASEIVTTRWTLLILREIISGSHNFNEIHRGVPLMSRGLLSKRLKELEKWNVIERSATDEKGNQLYRLTASGEDLRPIIVALGVWGQKWIESALESGDWDAGVLMWDLKRRINKEHLPRGRTVMQFDFEDAPDEFRLWWLVVDESGTDLCQQDPGFDVDLYINAAVSDFARVWIGHEKISRAIAEEKIILTGNRALENSIGDWLLLAQVTDFAGLPVDQIFKNSN